MKVQFKPSVYFLLIALLFFACNSDSRENPRAYVEGKIVSATVDYNKFNIVITSDNAVVAQTMLESNGEFRLSGPIGNNGFRLRTSDRIKSFNTDKAGLSLSADGLQINVPSGITYLKFNEIVLE